MSKRPFLRHHIKPLAALAFSSLWMLTPSAIAQKKDMSEYLNKYSAKKYSPEEFEAMVPSTPNPWLSMLPDNDKIDWNYWNMKKAMDSQARFAQSNTTSVIMPGPDKFFFPFNVLPFFGTSSWQHSSVSISGEFELPAPEIVTPAAEDEGSLLLATEVNLESGNAIVVDSVIGDGLYGSEGTGSADFDFYALRDLEAGQTLMIDIDTPIPRGDLDPYIEVYNADGVRVAFNDDGDVSQSFDSFLSFEIPASGDYFISVGGFGSFSLTDLNDSSSGPGEIFGGALSEGTYTMTVGLDYFDEQTYVFLAKPGDVFGAAITGTASDMTLLDSTLTERQGSMGDVSFIFPDNSPLPSGLVSVNHVVDKLGFYRLRLKGMNEGAYTLQLNAELPTLRTAEEGAFQTIFVDFDGATVDLAESIDDTSPPGTNIVTLSPLSSFLPNWGLTDADEDAVIDSVMSVLEQSLVHDIQRSGRNRDFKIRLLNSRDHQDPFGMPNVSRVIVGGTIAELGVSTIGIAQSIDVGNFDTEETGFVLLDLLSAEATNPNSLNQFPISDDSSIIDLIGVGVGEIVAHEAGHYLGNWHTDQFNDQPNIMDQGGNLSFSVIGIGEDGIFGTADDVDSMFGRDVFNPNEGYTGIENTATSIGQGATQPPFRHVHDD